MKEMEDNMVTILEFYGLMATVAFFANPDMFAFLTCRIVQLTLKHGICKHSIVGFVQYAALLCGNKTTKDIEDASRIGKLALSCLKKRFYSAEQLPKIYFAYYGLVAIHNEPLQSCSDMIQQGFGAGMSSGEISMALLNSIHHVNTLLIAGEKLPALLEKADYYLDLADRYKNELVKSHLLIFRDTISTLIDKGESNSSKSKINANENACKQASSSEAMYFHRAIQAYWLGYNERWHHYVLKVFEIDSTTALLSNIVLTFIQGLNVFQVLKRQNTVKLRLIPDKAIAALKAAASHSQWNFRDKV